jgi:hypothetical protein
VVVVFAMERSVSVWTICFDMNLLTAAYSVRRQHTNPIEN